MEERGVGFDYIFHRECRHLTIRGPNFGPGGMEPEAEGLVPSMSPFCDSCIYSFTSNIANKYDSLWKIVQEIEDQEQDMRPAGIKDDEHIQDQYDRLNREMREEMQVVEERVGKEHFERVCGTSISQSLDRIEKFIKGEEQVHGYTRGDGEENKNEGGEGEDEKKADKEEE